MVGWTSALFWWKYSCQINGKRNKNTIFKLKSLVGIVFEARRSRGCFFWCSFVFFSELAPVNPTLVVIRLHIYLFNLVQPKESRKRTFWHIWEKKSKIWKKEILKKLSQKTDFQTVFIQYIYTVCLGLRKKSRKYFLTFLRKKSKIWKKAEIKY